LRKVTISPEATAQPVEPAQAATETIAPSTTPLPAPDYFGPVSRVEGKDFLVRNLEGNFEPFFVKGVDIGAAKPGYWPGEFGITQEDYARWFQLIGQMHANTIRVYVPQMPAFYDALLAYNLTAKTPLYLMQGIYMNEELIVTYLDAYCNGGELVKSFYNDLKNTIDIVHGNATVEKLPGNAGGTYTSDVSSYVIGYLPALSSARTLSLAQTRRTPTRRAFPERMCIQRTPLPSRYFLPSRKST
jgi:hypothetical protein